MSWPQKAQFQVRMKAYQNRAGKTQAGVAKALGISLPHLRNSLYTDSKRLGLDTLQRAAALFECDITEFVDNPNMELPGIDAGEMSQMTPTKRLLARLFVQRIAPDEVTDETAERYWRAIDGLFASGPLKATN